MNLEKTIYEYRKFLLKYGNVVKTDDWQGLQDGFEFLELQSVSFKVEMPETIEDLATQTNAWLPWAEDHFQERICGEPLNPPPSHKYWLKGNENFLCDEKFSHTYPERFWPKTLLENGIRFKTGDFEDLVRLLQRNRSTRQAYLPIYFPEDLSASNEGERVPCTLGYHIFIRDNKLNMMYPMRSCDAIRHFHNDLYMAGRLMQTVRDRVDSCIEIGYLHFVCSSFHCFKNDEYTLKKLLGL